MTEQPRDFGRYRLRNGGQCEVTAFSTADVLNAETGKQMRLPVAWGKDHHGNIMGWLAETGEHHVGGHVMPGSSEFDIVGKA